MRRLRAALAALACLAAGDASAEQLIIALSTGDIRIDSGFTGAAITVFGVIERDAETVSRAAPYQVAVLVRGPRETVVARRKEPLLFLWVNRDSDTFEDVPSFYALSSTGPLTDVAGKAVLQRFGIGLENVGHGAAMPPTANDPPAAEFRDAFIRLRKDAGLYSDFPGGVDFIGSSDSVFRSAAWIPSNAPDGRYIVEVFLFSGGALLDHQEAPLNITKVGFEQYMYAAAHDRALLFGLACVLLALFTGWLAGVIFRRD